MKNKCPVIKKVEEEIKNKKPSSKSLTEENWEKYKNLVKGLH